MEAFSSKIFLIVFAFSFITYSIQANESNILFIRSSCSSTTYPRLCYTSLVKYADSIQTNRLRLTNTALNVTLASAKSTSVSMSTIAKIHGLNPKEVAAMKDCVEVLSESVDELRRSINEISRLSTSNFELTMSDVQTWVSAALTDENTCTEGFQEINATGNIKTIVRGKIVQVAQLTSNALALINKLAASHP
jgi:pectinesterase inhibitor-like protein